MKIYSLYFTLFIFLASSVLAQTRTTQAGSQNTKGPSQTATQTKTSSSSQLAKSTQEISSNSKQISSSSDSLKMALNQVKSSFSSFFKPKRDTIAISISNIDYDNDNLTLLKEDIKKLKGVKSLAMQYKAATAMLEISFKGKSMDLWDALPQEAKQGFKLIEADDNNISLSKK
ncbi:MAG TPA: hypothetical protein VEV62_06340 [Parafilimonas sp.]|nr:hypothetical protein [Parafilimonas sp.]